MAETGLIFHGDWLCFTMTLARARGSISHFYSWPAWDCLPRMPYAGMINKDGKRVVPNTESFSAAAAGADWANAPGFYLILTDQHGAKSWPIVGATFILMHAEPDDPVAATEALKFFSWAYQNGSKMAEELDYVPLPNPVVALIKKKWAAEIKGADGKPLLN
jgi:phosphate transport system substrate-binding protein